MRLSLVNRWSGDLDHLEGTTDLRPNANRDVVLGAEALICTGIPFAVVGGVARLWLRALPVSISALIGFVALAGVATPARRTSKRAFARVRLSDRG